ETRLQTPVDPSKQLAVGPGAKSRPDGGDVRAVFAYDRAKKNKTKWTLSKGQGKPGISDRRPFLSPLSPRARWQIVKASTNTKYAARADIHASKLKLSTMGGTLIAKADWKTNGAGILQWEHKATMGRDHFAKVVEEGYLFPWGHKAT